MDVNYLYQFSLRLIRKNQSGGLTATEFGYFWNDAQGSYQDDLVGRFQRNNNSKEGNNTGLIENATILTKLNPFKKPLNITIDSGKATKPDDFVFTMAVRCNNYKVIPVNADKVWSLYDDVIDPPSADDNSYYYSEYQDYYNLFPNTVTSIDIDYISTPTDVVWGFVLDTNNRQVYSSAASIQPQWDANSCREITKRMLKTIGVSFQDKDFEQFGQSVIQSGE